ncbi:MAG: hypothetical protein J3R72DRAFT_447338 [Linnemannia gamsii]|nr:MAG: hypothetical protein J3R72DRAFT_447338 [Linnemannia gamsii]
MLQALNINRKQADEQHPTIDQLLARVNNQNKALTLLTEQVFAMATRLDEATQQNRAQQDALVQQFITKLEDMAQQHKTQLEDMDRKHQAQLEGVAVEGRDKSQVKKVVPQPKETRQEVDMIQDDYHTYHSGLETFSLIINDDEADVNHNQDNTHGHNGRSNCSDGGARQMDMREVVQWLGEGYRRMDDLDAWMDDVLVRVDRIEARFDLRKDRVRDERDWDMEAEVEEPKRTSKTSKRLDKIDNDDEGYEAEERMREKEMEEQRLRDQYRSEVKSRARGKRKSLDFDFVSDLSGEDFDDHDEDEELEEDDDDYKEEEEKPIRHHYRVESDDIDEEEEEQEEGGVADGKQPLTSVFGHRTLNLLLDEVAELYYQPSKKEAIRQGVTFKFHTPISSALEEVWQRWVISEPDRPSVWCLEAYTDKWRKDFTLTEKSAYYIQRRIIYNVFKHLRHINKTAGTTATLTDRVEQAITIVKDEIDDVGSLYKYSRPPTKKRTRRLRHQQPNGTAGPVSAKASAKAPEAPAAVAARSKRARKARRFDDYAK